MGVILFAGDASEPALSGGGGCMGRGGRPGGDAVDAADDEVRAACDWRSSVNSGPLDLQMVPFDSYKDGGKGLGIRFRIWGGRNFVDFEVWAEEETFPGGGGPHPSMKQECEG